MNDAKNLFTRFPQNPILTPLDIHPSMEGLQIECLLNPGVFRYKNKTGLLLRVAERPLQKEDSISFPILNSANKMEIIEIAKSDPALNMEDPRVITYRGDDYLTTISHLCPVFSDDGIHFSMMESTSRLFGNDGYSSFGIEDCRVTQIGDEYFLTYTSVSPNGVGVGLKRTKDWRHYIDSGLIFPPHNKDCAIFEEKINGLYYALHRPSSSEIGGNYIWIAESPDLIHWGNHKCIARTRAGKFDSARLGAGCAPVKTEKGWLAIYHGATKENRYCLGALLLDINDPSVVIARSEHPIMEPETTYEKQGFFGEVIFTNGQLVNEDELVIYYGAADSVICGARASITSILQTLGF